MSLLQRICSQIANQYGLDANALTGEGDKKEWHEINGLSTIFRKCLAFATPEKPLIVFLDALDQLSDTDNAKSFYWLPKDLPANSKIIISALPEYQEKLSDTQIIPLRSLPEKDARDILNLWFEVTKRDLTDYQKQKVISNFNQTGEENNKSGLPIYLKLAFEIAKHWHSYDNEYPLKPDVKGIINDYFEYLESEEFPEDFVKTAVCYILSGRYEGLTETEILEILAFDENYWESFLSTSKHINELKEMARILPKGTMKIPIAVWSRLYFDIEPFLTERDADGVPIITFFHRQFNEVLRERYDLI
jgi:NACHT domain- and WD repeat-containing protein